MIDIWILTVVVGDGAGMTSFQIKFYDENQASDASMFYKNGANSTSPSFLYITLCQTQEQKIS